MEESSCVRSCGRDCEQLGQILPQNWLPDKLLVQPISQCLCEFSGFSVFLSSAFTMRDLRNSMSNDACAHKSNLVLLNEQLASQTPTESLWDSNRKIIMTLWRLKMFTLQGLEHNWVGENDHWQRCPVLYCHDGGKRFRESSILLLGIIKKFHFLMSSWISRPPCLKWPQRIHAPKIANSFF